MENQEGIQKHVFGTLSAKETIEEEVKQALKQGYRHFDTAERYEGMEMVGKAIQESGVNRSELKITSKIGGMPIGSYEKVKERVEKMLKDLQTEYVDVLLIHWPGPESLDLLSPDLDPESIPELCSFGWFAENVAEAWKNMLQLKADGLAREIGLSNFGQAHIEELLRHFPSENDRPY